MSESAVILPSFIRVTEAARPLRAAGFVDDGLTDGGEWGRPSRPRKPVEQSGPKRRWVWPATARPVARECVA